ncbi:Putative C2H2 type zinc finger domain protein [Penicillium brasilianum]|uniref:Putative C2H2 type zinc finger domain protein n=1 Tax=Penicillium brasilianum TaxID=104259 RepID=A0A0F7U4W6_PENBI|nr:Putative C2H2 type zinc finger domain protein [Penicillium brasilianum]
MGGFGSELELHFHPSPSDSFAHDTFRCRFPSCNARYRRKEHLKRHEESNHAQQQDFVCSSCGRQFKRSDTLRRHVQKQHKITEPLTRARRACASCHASKSRCEGGFPCGECVRRNVHCSFQDIDASAAEKQEQHPSSLIPRSSSSNQKESQIYYLEKRKQCVHYYFDVFHPFWPFIHKATFDVHQETPLLLQSIVAIGMWTSGERSTQSAAVELHNNLDSAIRDQREKWDASEAEGACSTCFWPIATYQAILLHVIFSVLVKSERAVNLDLKASISAADLTLLESLVGSCRRLGMFFYPNILAKYKESDLPGFVWVGVEEIKRFNIALYKLCAKLSSESPNDKPLLPAGELQFPLPSNDSLWNSVERHEWEAYAKLENTVSLSDDFQAKWISNLADVLGFFGV